MSNFEVNMDQSQSRSIGRGVFVPTAAIKSCSWKTTLVATTLGLLAGCASTSSTTNSNQGAQYRWEKPGASDSDWNQDRGQCMAQGFAATGSNPAIASGFGNPAYTNIMFQQAMIFASCMQGKGWLRIQVR
jgi:uncharacterized protein YceK